MLHSILEALLVVLEHAPDLDKLLLAECDGFRLSGLECLLELGVDLRERMRITCIFGIDSAPSAPWRSPRRGCKRAGGPSCWS